MAAAVVLLTGFGVLAVRVVQVQAVSAGRYRAFGESQRVRTVDLPADRGTIFDRSGHDLALTVERPTVTANPRLVTDPLAAAHALAPLLGATPSEMQSRLIRDRAFVYLARRVDDAVAARVHDLRLPGIEVITEPQRFLPSGELAMPLLGRVGVDNAGLSGLEYQFERRLAGQPGRMVVERPAAGGVHEVIPGGKRLLQASTRGDDLVLTVDRSLQYETERALAAGIVRASAKGGIAMVMETRTGEVLALAELEAAEKGRPPRPAPRNTAFTDVFEPGSVNKMITVSAALEEDLIKPDDRLAVPSSIKVADHVFKEHDAQRGRRWSVTEIMANSSNVGTIMIGQRLGRDRIDHYLRAFGFGTKTAVGFPGESSGILLEPEKWSGTSIGTIPIGQGVAVTAVQTLAAYNTVANGGVYVAPKLVRATVDPDGSRHSTPAPDRRRVLSDATARQVTAMLTEVVRVGTGELAAVEGYTVAGKTGTARKPRTGARGYKEGAYVSSFAGFVPAERPQLTVVVILDEPTPIFGGLVAAPVFAEVSRYALRQLRVPSPPAGRPPAAVPPAAPENAKGLGDAVDVGAPLGPGRPSDPAP